MATGTKDIILAESSRFIGQISSNVVLHLHSRIREIEALACSVARIVENLPKDPALFLQVLPPLINFQGDSGIAGGGFWAEPWTFTPEQERCSFFWNRNEQGILVFYDDYNQSREGYHQEPWYRVGHYLQLGQCFWSASYIDPYTMQPMITCTTPTFAGEKMSGVVTIDLKLQGLQAEVEQWRTQTGGYMFIVDYQNKFVTFPQPEKVLKGVEERGKHLQEFMVAQEFAATEPLFLPIATALDHWNQDFLKQQQTSAAHSAIATNLQVGSPMTEYEAQLMASIILDSLQPQDLTNFLQHEFEIEQDWFAAEASTVFLFRVPRTYFKLVVVKPFSEATMMTYSLIQTEKMSSMGQFVAGMAHEINNPVSFIYGNISHADTYVQDLLQLVERYQQELPNPSPAIRSLQMAIDLDFLMEDLPRILNSIKIGADRIRQLVVSLRNFARSDEAGLKFVNLYEGIDNTLSLLDGRLRNSATQQGIQVVREYGDLPLVECHAGLMNQVFMNVLINAIDALDESKGDHKTITIRGQQLNSNWVRLAIADNGPGIPYQVRQQLFDPFFTTKPIGKGTGLGLAVCYQIVTEKHGGKLSCYSTRGNGAEFVIELPIQQLSHKSA